VGVAHGRVALALALATSGLAAVAPAARADFGISEEISALTQLDQLVHGKSRLTPTERTAVHSQTAALIASGAYAAQVQGVTYADLLTDLGCVGASLQHARNAPRSNKRLELRWANAALDCQRALAAALAGGGQATSATQQDVAQIAARIKVILVRIGEHHVFGAKATDVRHFIVGMVEHDFSGPFVFGLAFTDHFRALECVDVKVESGRFSGASACIHRLRRLLRRHISK